MNSEYSMYLDHACYECGQMISGENHFCHLSTCGKEYRSRFYTDQEFYTALSQVTKKRKKDGIPYCRCFKTSLTPLSPHP